MTAMIDLGHGVRAYWDDEILVWEHSGCRGRYWLAFKPDERSTGHVLVSRLPLTIEGSLLCPKGCGRHGTITDGKWSPC